MNQLDDVTANFTRLTKVKCSNGKFKEIIERLLPIPAKPRNLDRNPGLKKAYEAKVADILAMRNKIDYLRKEGKGMNMEGSNGTFWGVLNAITEYVDHYRDLEGSRISYILLGDGMGLKIKAHRLIQEEVTKMAA